jgi:hypothetical protein
MVMAVNAGRPNTPPFTSLVQSCKNLGNEPFAYLRDVPERVGTHAAIRVDDLLPDRRVLPEASLASRRKG